MRPATATDHGTLALLAQNPAAELRPLLLRVHVQSFAAAPPRDAAARASFETIALGLIPLVPDDVLAEAARILRGLDDVPRAVLAALGERIGPVSNRRDEPPSPARRRPAVSPPVREVALARNLATTLDPETLGGLIQLGAKDREVAQALLSRPEPTVFDRAALYRHADPEERDDIRRSLGAALSAIHVPRPLGESEAAREMLRIAALGDARAFRLALSSRIGVEPETFDFGDPVGQEMVLFALVAIGLSEPECVRALLMLDSPLAHSVPALFRIAELARTTPRPVAAFLAGYERMAPARARAADIAQPSRTAGTSRSDGRADPRPWSRRADQSARDLSRDARAGRRS